MGFYDTNGNQSYNFIKSDDEYLSPTLPCYSKSLRSYISRHSDSNRDSNREESFIASKREETFIDINKTTEKNDVDVVNDRKPLFYHEMVHNYYCKPSGNKSYSIVEILCND